MKDDRLYIQHALDCIERIDRYCQNEEDFRKPRLSPEMTHYVAHLTGQSTDRRPQSCDCRLLFLQLRFFSN